MATISALRLTQLLGNAHPQTEATTSGFASLPKYRQLSELIKNLLIDGKLSVGDRLPSERDLSLTWQASRTTITTAYRDLREAGYAISRQGSGSVLTLPGSGAGVARRSLLPPSRTTSAIDLTCATLPAAPGITSAYQAALLDLPHWLGHGGYEVYGIDPLREMVAARYEQRGVPTDPEQILITTGAVSALNVVLRALAQPGDRALMENPSYPNAVDAVAHSGLRLVSLPMDHRGWSIEALEAVLRQSAPRFAVLVPDFHNPTGALVPDAVRAQAARALRRARTVTIIDETLADLDLGGNPTATPYCGFDPTAISLGSLSKSSWGGLRVGWIRAPREQVAALVESRATMDLGTPILDQLAAVHVMARRHEVLPARLATIRAQRDVLADALRSAFPDWEIPSPGGGLALWCRLPHPVAGRLVQSAELQGLQLAHGARFGIDGGFERYLRLPFTAEQTLLLAAVERLERAYHELGPDAVSLTQHRGPLIA